MNARELQAKMILRDISIGKMCEELKMDRSTWWRKVNQLVEFTRSEISLIAKVLDLKDEEIIRIFFPGVLRISNG